MVGTFRPRPLAKVALLGALALGLTACGEVHPNSTFNHNTEYNTAIDGLWDILLWLGTAVFIGVEAALVYVMYRFRRRPNQGYPKPVHGNTKLEILWTAIPAVILVFIAIPTVKTIFKTQAKAAPDALQVEVIGHQWWWEFRYPQLGITTANELYLENGKTVSFQLKTIDVLHSFWIPQMGGKRDLITNHTNYLWFTPNDTLPASVWNGACAEYCGTSHANMKFRVYTLPAAEFKAWAEHTKGGPIFPATSAAPAPAAIPVVNTPGAKPAQAKAADSTAAAAPAAVAQAPVYEFPVDKIEKDFAYTIPKTPIPAGNDFPDALLASGDPVQGAKDAAICSSCHSFKQGVSPMNSMTIGPNLTHVGSRHTLAGGLYPMDPQHLARWIRNAPKMKPGVAMITLGKGLINPNTGKTEAMGQLSDQQIANIVAYLRALK